MKFLIATADTTDYDFTPGALNPGWTDILPHIAFGGLSWTRNDVEASDAGRTQDGVMHRGRVASKKKLQIKCRPLTSANASVVLNAILPETVKVAYTDPQDGNVNKIMYSNNNPASFCIMQPDGTEYWDGISFPLIEI